MTPERQYIERVTTLLAGLYGAIRFGVDLEASRTPSAHVFGETYLAQMAELIAEGRELSMPVRICEQERRSEAV